MPRPCRNMDLGPGSIVNQEILLSIVVPNWNGARFLPQTLQSICNSGRSDVEVLIQDGASADESHAVALPFLGDLVTWTSERDNGQSNAINIAALRARGQYITWINSDDELNLEAVLATLDHPDGPAFHKTIHCGSVDWIDEEGNQLKSVTPRNLTKRDVQRWWMRKAVWQQPGMIFPRGLWSQLNGLDTTYRFVFDLDFVLRCLDAGTVFRVHNGTWASFRVHSLSKTFGEGSNWPAEYVRLYSAGHPDSQSRNVFGVIAGVEKPTMASLTNPWFHFQRQNFAKKQNRLFHAIMRRPR
jgi:glycosyltransferase involved in cell wall biosynthesis